MSTPDGGNPYLARINRVIDHVYAHPDGDLSLDALAAVAGFSPFHFHRIFKAQAGETLHAFALRIRIGRAAALLRAAPDRSVTRVAFECGFSSSSDFSRAFRRQFGIAPGKWDRATPLEDSKIWKAEAHIPVYTLTELADVEDRGEFRVEIQPFPATRVAYVRIANSYDYERMLAGYRLLIDWLHARFGGLPSGRLIGTSQDDPDVTPRELCRYDFCYTVADDVEAEGDIGIRMLPPCTVAAAHCEGDGHKLVRVWDWLFRWWLPRSTWQPASLPALEVYRRTPEEVGWETFDLDACIPVEPILG
jgi:AraC family transcriptional regulator